jgi:hypothetical protein
MRSRLPSIRLELEQSLKMPVDVVYEGFPEDRVSE